MVRGIRLSMMIAVGVLVLWGALRAEQDITVPSIVNKRHNPNEVIPLQLAPGFGTLIQLPETVEGVYLGDPSSFQVEWADRDVYVKPVTGGASQSNLFVRTASGKHIRFYLRSEGGDVPMPERIGAPARQMTYVVSYALPQTSYVIAPRDWNEVSGTALAAPSPALAPRGPVGGAGPAVVPRRSRLDELFDERQEFSSVKKFDGGDVLQGAILRVTEENSMLYVLFRVRNNGSRVLRLLEPQVMLDTLRPKGVLRPGQTVDASEWLPRIGVRMESLRLDPGQTADGIIVVQMPPALDSNQKMVLALSDSLAADKPLRLSAELGRRVLDSMP